MKAPKFADLPITHKLNRLQAITFGLALLFTLLFSSITQLWHQHNEVLINAQSTGNIIGYNASAALLFNDVRSASDILSALQSVSNITAAQIYTTDGQPFAHYSTDYVFDGFPPLLADAEDQERRQSILSLTHIVIQPISPKNDVDGYLYLLIDLRPMWWELLGNLGQITLLILAAFSLSALYGRRLATLISTPLINLSMLAQHVSRDNNYAVRAIGESKDEIGQLVKSFNQMIEQIQERDSILENYRNHLESEVDARTLDFRKAALEAQAANVAKSQFLANMSHEIRTPMNGVLGMTELLLKTELSSRQTRLAETAYRSAESLLGIINNILDFSKIEAGKLQLNHNNMDIRALLEDVSETLAGQAHQKHLEFLLNLPVDLNGSVRGDSDRLRQVLINLLGNAIKFTHDGEVQLRVSRLQPTDKHQLHLLFEVIDSGIGIPSDQQQVIFESFKQVDGSITRRFGGTGLGLTISKELVELMGGQLGVSSTRNIGSRFYFSLKFEQFQQATSQPFDIGELQGINVLAVDDCETNRQLLCAQLSYWGVNCDCAASGNAAISQLQTAASQHKSYQLILLDWHMPDTDGLTLAKTIAKNPGFPRTPIIMLSSDSIVIDLDKDADIGIRALLTKPVIQRKLLHCLLDVLGDKNAAIPILTAPAVEKTNVIQGLILIAEDEPINQEVGKYMLQELGYQVDIVNDGFEAISACAKKTYDLVFMDCHMPNMSGFEATRAIREHEQSDTEPHRVPIIALTADVQNGIVEQCLMAGMDGYLSKPFNKNQLTNVLNEWTAARHVDVEFTRSTDCSHVAPTPYISERRSIVLNEAALDNLRQIHTVSGETLLNSAVSMFIQAAPKTLQSLRTALNNEDLDALRKTAHGFKSVCANLGVQNLADCSASIEHTSQHADLASVEALLSTMEINLPKVIVALTRELDALALDRPNEVRRSIQSELQGKRILLVDDDSDFRLITSEALRASGFLVDEAESSHQALEKIAQQIPDLVLLDAVMEGLDGFETCRLLRSLMKMADVPIIMSTGLRDIDSINRAFEVGADDFVIKPLNYPILMHRIRFILRASQNIAELRSNKFQLSAAQRIARLGYWTWDSIANQFHLSEHLAKLCNIDSFQFNNTLDAFIALIHPDDQSFVRNIITTAADNENARHAEYRLVVDGTGSIVVHQEIEAFIENNQCIITGTVQDITHKKQSEIQIHRLAYFDTLTGLASRAYYHERIESYIKNANRQHERFAFFYLDLDGFKDINDSYGHELGDQFLKGIAERLRAMVGDNDFAARLGGDEFCIILDNITSEADVAEFADRCLLKINQPLPLNQHQIKPRVSIGIALYPKDGSDEFELIKAADAAMYAAKELGKQRYIFYSEEMANQAISRLESEQVLREAFELDQFVLYYQPQISMQSGRMIGIEALVRWQHPEKGLVLPGEFIPLVERLGLITELGNWVLQAACEQIFQWHEAGLPYIRVSVNIAPGHFQEPALFHTVHNLLMKTAIPAEYLELEVTESAMQTQGSIEIFSQLRALGVKIALDDFGTGYSCLASLKQLPLDCLKVDKVFVDDVLTDPHTALLLGTIIGLANALNYTLVAEGVETQEQALVMHGLGCHIIQGCLFSSPVSADKIPELINRDFMQPHTYL